MKGTFFLALAIIGLTACGESQQQAASVAKPVEAQIVEAPQAVEPEVDHYYSLKDGLQYGYETALSQDQIAAGQMANTLTMFKYAGEKDGVYQVYTEDAGNIVTTIQCTNPCDFMKIMVFSTSELISTERLKATEGTIGWLVMADAINGKLEKYQGKAGSKMMHVWFDEQEGFTATPVEENTDG